MHAFFDIQDGNPKISLQIKGTKRKSKKINALMDTGHNGSLSLPLLTLIDIGAELSSYGLVGLADGRFVNMYYFKTKVVIDEQEKEVEASMIENPEITEAIAGLELFQPYTAVIDFKNKKIQFSKEFPHSAK